MSSIVTSSFRNEGHFRAGERIGGTSDFFSGAFTFPGSSAEFREIVGMVNLRHHVAGVVMAVGDGGVRVVPGYEADYAYVATAFIESIRRGLTLCGLAPDSRGGRDLAAQNCTILYQLAGFTGLTRVPRDLAAHERFRDAYERRLRARPPSARVRRMAQEIARRIVPFTAFMAGLTAHEHVERHIDPETREFLFPGGGVPAELERRRLALNSALVGTLLDDTAARTGSPLMASIAQLFHLLTGDSHVTLDAVIDLPVDATPDECVEALRRQVDEAIRAGGLPPELERYLAHVVATIG